MKKVFSIALLIPIFLIADATEAAPKKSFLGPSSEMEMKQGSSGDAGVVPQEMYSAIVAAVQKKNWNDVIENGKNTIKDFPDFTFLSDVYFYTGVAYFHKGDYELADYYFTNFLKKHPSPKFFEEAIVYKFRIAEKFETGARKHLMGLEMMPQWLPAYDDALVLYDEVITTLPKHEVAAKSLFNKGTMLARGGKYKEGIEQFQTIIRRFPKDPLAPESYVSIANVYLEQCNAHYPDPDFLDLARLNLKKFQGDFPNEARLKDVEEMLGHMQDHYAKDLWNSAFYYDKKKKAKAALVYYQAIVARYPESSYVPAAVKRLSALKTAHPEWIQELESADQILTAN